MTGLRLPPRSASFVTGPRDSQRQKLVQPSKDRTRVHFGTTVVVRREDGRMQTFRIVGEDEADPSGGTVSHVSPLARAVLGKSVGDVVTVLGRDAEVLEIK
jgi:transcription elongation GreA/GreB family factor